MRSVGFAVLVLIFSALSAAAQPLDGFLSGMLRGCQMSPEFNDFMKSLADRASGRGKARIPPQIYDAIGRADVRDRGDYYEIAVPFTGTWKRLPLRGITYFLGKDNGIYGWQVLFRTSLSSVRATFGGDLQTSRRLLLKDDVMGIYSADSIKIGTTRNGTPYFSCDLST